MLTRTRRNHPTGSLDKSLGVFFLLSDAGSGVPEGRVVKVGWLKSRDFPKIEAMNIQLYQRCTVYKCEHKRIS
jgi:hypothetical protein